MLSDTATRVQRHTASRLNDRIRNEMESRVSALKSDDRTALVDRRLAELDREWDIERVLKMNFAILSLVGLAMTAGKSRRWLLLALGVPAFMIQHSLQGWCPPLPILRRLGFRTSKEINEERFALKSLRGDFDHVAHSASTDDIVRAVTR